MNVHKNISPLLRIVQKKKKNEKKLKYMDEALDR